MDKSAGAVQLSPEVNSAILWQKDEIPVEYGSSIMLLANNVSGYPGWLIVTNQRILFAQKMGILGKDCGIVYCVNLEDVVSLSRGRCGLFAKSLIVLEKNNQHKAFAVPRVERLIPRLYEIISKRITELESQKGKERIQIVVDFSSLKDTLTKGGIIMTTCNCPKCNAMVDIPETGKVLICKYCGTPIKPVDIFEKIKSLTQ